MHLSEVDACLGLPSTRSDHQSRAVLKIIWSIPMRDENPLLSRVLRPSPAPEIHHKFLCPSSLRLSQLL